MNGDENIHKRAPDLNRRISVTKRPVTDSNEENFTI